MRRGPNMSKYERMVGQTLPAFNAIITQRGDPLDLAGKTVKFRMNQYGTTTAVVAETASHVTAHPTQAFTADTSTDLLTCNAHGVNTDDQVVLATTDTIPGGLTVAIRYFAVQVTPNSFGISLVPGGAKIDITTTGAGQHTFYIVGS